MTIFEYKYVRIEILELYEQQFIGICSKFCFFKQAIVCRIWMNRCEVIRESVKWIICDEMINDVDHES